MNLARVFFGAVIVVVGALFLLDNLDAVDAGEVISNWWPVLLIVAGLLSFLNNRRHWVVPLILVGGGGVLLLRTTGVVDDLSVIVPVLIIIVGLLFVFGRGLGVGPTQTGDSVNSFNLFSGSELTSQSRSFEGGRVGVLFGGAELDLRGAQLARDATLDVFAAFGGVEISVPRGWRVDIGGFPVFGGYENATGKEDLAPDAPRLRIDATVLFGGLEVKH
jgi:hypothetical protein